MEYSQLSKEFKHYLDSLEPGYKTTDWIYIGHTKAAFGSRGGSWEGTDGFEFQEIASNQNFLIRCISDKGYIVLESFSTRRQIFNMDLSNSKIHINKKGQSILLESFDMTAGKGRIARRVVKDAFRQIGVNSNEIANISDSNPNWEGLVASLLTWTKYREEAKRVLKKKVQTKSEEVVDDSTKENDTKAINSESLNQILYGPPGTGKTYRTIDMAVGITSGNQGSHEANKVEFDKMIESGQIQFVTFHQSMSYEDFIEGIKPLKPDESKGEVKYDVIPGIFKSICELASRGLTGGQIKNQEELYRAFIDDLANKLEEGEEVVFQSKSNTDVVIHSFSNNDSPYASPRREEGDLANYLISKDKFLKLDAYFEKMEDIKNVVEDIRRVIKGVGHTYYWALLNEFKKFKAKHQSEVISGGGNDSKNFVLIIDEINRGNIAAIFGELITLIEEDKREGEPNAIKVKLPYSKDPFSVPSNLYIIGTMNTADRSVEALDTALRRRFSFEEMPPDYNLKELKGEYAGVALYEILETINTRIEKLLDKDHTIGHSYFMLGEDEDIEAKLVEGFYKNIIPLLQEYFFGDFAKIGLVLGAGFVHKKEWNGNNGFAVFEGAEDYSDREVFTMVDYRQENPQYFLNFKGESVEMDFEKAIKLLMKQGIE